MKRLPKMGYRQTKRNAYFEVFVVVTTLVLKVCSSPTKIEDGLFSSTNEKKDVIVSFGTMQEIKGIVHQITSQYTYSSKEERIYAMYQAMSSYSTKCQSSAKDYLDSASYTYHDMWSSNTVIIRDADHSCVTTLADMSDVTSIRQDTTLPLIDPVIDFESEIFSDTSDPNDSTTGTTYGLNNMQVRQAWKYGSDYGYGTLKTGTGVTVANIDTGVNYKHISLKDNFRSYAGWMDGYGKSDKPQDLNGHGTHTMGTICGQGGIGVAPGAQWIACRGCFQRGCLQSALLKCCQWILCPHDVSKTGPENYRDCSTAPDVVSNSWGGGQGDKTFERCALALRAAGIIPVWAIGNAGPECTTANSPGDLKYVIAVGATDENDELCKFSSRGPTFAEGAIKPDVAAPGMHTKSCWHNTTTSFISISGTSMATPHVSGLVALILERCRLPYKSVLNVLQATAERDNLGKLKQVCGDTKSDQFPNNFYGYGRVNALEAIKKVVQICHLNKSYYGTNSYNSIPYHSGAIRGYSNYANNPNFAYSSSHSTPPYSTHNYAYAPYPRGYSYYNRYY